MLAFALAAVITAADLQMWMNDQPQVRAYEEAKASVGVEPPPADAFRRSPTLSSPTACALRRQALDAAVMLFRSNDGGRITLAEPALQADNDGRSVLVLNDAGKKALTERAQRYEQEAGRFEPACLG